MKNELAQRSRTRGWDLPFVDVLPEDTAFTPSNVSATGFLEDVGGNISDMLSLNAPDNKAADENTLNRLAGSVGEIGSSLVSPLKTEIVLILALLGGAWYFYGSVL